MSAITIIIFILVLIFTIPLFFHFIAYFERKADKNMWKLSFMMLSISNEGFGLFWFRFPFSKLKKKKKDKKEKSKEKPLESKKTEKTKEEISDTEESGKDQEKDKDKDKKKTDKEKEITLKQVYEDVRYYLSKRGVLFQIIRIFVNCFVNILKDIKFSAENLIVWIGLGNPAHTGMVSGFLYSFNKIVVYPDFNNVKFNINGKITIKLRLGNVVYRGLVALWQLPKIEIIRVIKYIKGGKNGKSNRRNPEHPAGKGRNDSKI